MFICVAGKNRIAIEAVKYIQAQFTGIGLVGCKNATDDGINNWQPSFSFYCLKNNIPLVSLDDLYEIEDLLLISLEFDKIIKPEKFRTARLFNIHFSKLPAYKGMYTSVMPLLNGEDESGVTLHVIDKGIDTGNIIAQQVFPISLETTARDLYELYLDHGLCLFKQNIQRLIDNNVTAIPQPIANSSYYSKATLKFANLFIDLKKTAFEIHNQVRAFVFRDYQLPKILNRFIYKSEMIDIPATGKAGSVVYEDEWYIVLNTIDYQIKLFIDRQEDLFAAAEHGDIAVYIKLKDAGYPVQIKSKQGWDALIVSCYHNKHRFVEYLLADGWDCNTCNYKGTTALMYAMTAASKENDINTLKSFENCDVNWFKNDDKGKNIFIYANEYDNNRVIEYVNKYNRQ